MLETLGNELNRLKKLQNGRKKHRKVITLFALIVFSIQRQCSIGWSVLDIEKHELHGS